MAAIALMVGAIMAACSKDDAPNQQEEPEFYTVKFGWGGEIVDIAYEPLDTRAAGNDLYGIQVYSKPNNNSTATSWEAYAYGVFDDPTDISIELASGNKYKFVATMVVDGKERIGSTDVIIEESEVRYYAEPFRVYYNEIGTFDYDYKGNLHESSFDDSTASLNYEDGKSFGVYDIPNLDRYYGRVDEFIPSSSNTNITISMKRVSFGAKFIAEGALAKSGTLDIQIQGAPKMSLVLTEDEDSISDIFTFSDIYTAWLGYFPDPGPDYPHYAKYNVAFKWIRPDKTELQIGTFPITYKRNTTTVVTIQMENDVVEGDQTGGVGFSIASSETGEMPENDNSVTIVDGEVEGADEGANE